MRKFLLPLIVLLLCSGNLVSINAQQPDLQEREAEWQNYVLPKTNFTRKNDAGKNLVFRIPADWQQQGETLIFEGPHNASLKVFTQTIPEGYPIDEFFGATLRVVRDQTGGADSLVTRRTELQDIEAREMVWETSDPNGELVRSVAWFAIYGPNVYGFYLRVPAAHAAEAEPYFKAMVQSAAFISPDPHFEELRANIVKSTAANPIDELEKLVESLNGTAAQREASINRLTALFASQPELVIDLLRDRRSLIRVAAVRAASDSHNSALTPFLWELLADREPLVSEAAARAVANGTDVVTKTLEHSMSGFQTERIARVWPFMPMARRKELAELIFKQTAVRHDPPPAVAPPPAPVTPPASGSSPPTPASSPRPRVSITIADAPPVRRGPKSIELTMASAAAESPEVQLGVLTLLTTMPPEEFKIPLARIIASNYEPLIAAALQVALVRGEVLSVPPLLKLLSSSNAQVRKYAAENVAIAASAADIPQIEALISKNGSRKEIDDELRLVVRKIQFRNTLATAKNEDEKRALISKSLTDPVLADFAWRHDCEATVVGCGGAVAPKPDLTIKPLGENLFPQKLKLYTAIPKPRQAVQRFYESLHGMQMESPRTQASLMLMLTNVRKLVAQAVNAPGNADELIDYTGIDGDAPIALGSWTAANAPAGVASAERKAIVLRVKDRARFERNVANVQQLTGGFMKLTEGVGIVSRTVAALPAAIPFTAQAVLSADPSARPKSFPVLHYSFIADKEWNGLKLRLIENQEVANDWTITTNDTYILYLGDTAILAPDLASLREALANASATGDRKLLADNSEFRQANDSHGDVIYFSDLNAIFADPAAKQINESGGMKFSASAWETSHHFTFNASDWAKPLVPFHPKELTAARELLPASTIGYYLMKVDTPAIASNSSWSSAYKPEFESFSKVWALEFKQEVLPELGPECGIGLTALPDIKTLAGTTLVAFCKLKSNKLADALTAGKLFRGVGPTPDVAELKVGDDSFFIATRAGFLVVSNRAQGIAVLDGKTNLASTRDYLRSVEKVPNGVVAFGGYNLEAAIAAASNGATEGVRGQIANVLFSLASAFHSQNFYATATADTVEAHSSVSMDREGRYAAADFGSLPSSTTITYATVEPHGVPITDQRRLSNLVLRVRAKTPGPIDGLKDDIASVDQKVEQKSATELLVSVAARMPGAEKAVQLPVTDPALAQYLKATPEFAADRKEVIDQARKIAGDDRDAWSVARKLADWTNKNLEWKLVAYANPVDTLATREADCSEFSALFIAMARSLGLPARMVSGLAYGGSSFGGHAWVEVWAGRWIELDPTWGTSFVDATHIRNANNALVTSAALNLIDLEVVEAKRTAGEFQKSPRALAEHLSRVIPGQDKSEIEAAVDLDVLVDEYMGPGSWARLNDAEREQMWLAYRRVINELLGYGTTHYGGTQRMRVVHVEEKGDTAEAFCVLTPVQSLFKMRFVRRDGMWHVVEVFEADDNLATAAEVLRPTIDAIARTRAGEKIKTAARSDFSRLLLLVNKDPARTVELADELLKTQPKDKGFRFVKAIALLNEAKPEPALKLLTELSDEGFAPATHRMAEFYGYEEDEADPKKTVEWCERYARLEPYDPRAWSALASAYTDDEKFEQAAAAYRKAIEIDPAETGSYRSLIEVIVAHNLTDDVRALLVAGEKYQQPHEDLFGSVMRDLSLEKTTDAAEKFAASEPLRMKTSALANLTLGEIFTKAGKYVAAERSLNTALQLSKQAMAVEKKAAAADVTANADKPAKPVETLTNGEGQSVAAYVALARLYRKQSRWLTALKATDQALAVNPSSAEAYLERACVYARLRRFDEAIAALKRVVDLSPFYRYRFPIEDDLKPLSNLPAFKELLPKETKEEP